MQSQRSFGTHTDYECMLWCESAAVALAFVMRAW
jgi:hypothetical protein